MIIQDIYDVDIKIDNLSIFNAQGVSFVGCDIYEAINNPIPICKLELNVPLGWVDLRSIVDGTKIDIIVKCKQYNINEIYEFRLYNIIKLNINQLYTYLNIEAVLDAYKGYTDANKYNNYCNTSDIFNVIAKELNLKPDIDKTEDSQLWVAGENNTYQFLEYLSQYGWINETSAMFWCIDRNKNLLYKNLTTLFRNRQRKIWTFIQTDSPNTDDKQFGYTKANGSILAGKNNLDNIGYGRDEYYFDILEYKLKKTHSKKVIAESNIINISKELSNNLSSVLCPFDVGNFNKNYFNSFNQNKRILSTYSSYITVSSSFFQPYRLGQIVNFEYIDSEDPLNKLNLLSGIFMIDAIHIKIDKNTISSTAELVMQGLNGKAITRETY